MSTPIATRIRGGLLAGGLAALLVVGSGGAAGAQIPPLPIPLPVPIPLLGGSGPTLAGDLQHQVLATSAQTVDPTALDVTPDGRVVFAERKGPIKVITTDGQVVTAVRIPVAANQCTDCPDQGLEEGGVHGLAFAADFASSGRVYIYYSVPGTEGQVPGFAPTEGAFRLSTFVLTTANTINLATEKVLMTNPAQWDNCCHYGGDLDWMADGTLLLSVADDTSPRDEGWNPRDKRPGREAFDADRTSQNQRDRRGKVLRLMPDGSVPDGTVEGIVANPHVGDPAWDPYVYAMGFRSNYRIAVDPLTDFAFVGNVGPDAGSDDANRGPRGHDEFETIPPGGGTNHGWPRCVANNVAYKDYDYETAASGALLSCAGMTPADIWYHGAASTQWPALATGGRTAIAGVVYRTDGTGSRSLPARFQGKLLLMEYSRNRLWSIPLKTEGADAGRMDTTQLVQEGQGLAHPIDAAIGPDGAVYLAEYGSTFYNNTSSRISRIWAKPAGESASPAGRVAAPAGPVELPGGVGLQVAVVLGAAALGALRRRRSIA